MSLGPETGARCCRFARCLISTLFHGVAVLLADGRMAVLWEKQTQVQKTSINVLCVSYKQMCYMEMCPLSHQDARIRINVLQCPGGFLCFDVAIVVSSFGGDFAHPVWWQLHVSSVSSRPVATPTSPYSLVRRLGILAQTHPSMLAVGAQCEDPLS